MENRSPSPAEKDLCDSPPMAPPLHTFTRMGPSDDMISHYISKIQDNLKQRGAFHVGKCGGKPVSATSSSRSSKKEEGLAKSPASTPLFGSQLPSLSMTSAEARKPSFGTNERSFVRSPSPPSFMGDRLCGVDTDSTPPYYPPQCTRKNTTESSNAFATQPFQLLSWDAPSFGPSFFGTDSTTRWGVTISDSKKRSSDEIKQEDQANTATAKIAAAAAKAADASQSQSCVYFSEFPVSSFFGGPRFTKEEADDLVSFVDKWIPTENKRRKTE